MFKQVGFFHEMRLGSFPLENRPLAVIDQDVVHSGASLFNGVCPLLPMWGRLGWAWVPEKWASNWGPGPLLRS